MTNKPTKSKEEFVADERAAERKVVEAEFALRKAELTNDPKVIQKAQKAVADARTESLKIRAKMTEGLAQWHTYDSEAELARVAKEMGINQ